MRGCTGECHRSCGPIPASPKERKLVEERSGKKLDVRQDMTCTMLTPNGRCSVYSIRPLICRLWGATQKMPCPWGCQPERWLSDSEAQELMIEIEKYSPGAFGELVRMFRNHPPDIKV